MIAADTLELQPQTREEFEAALEDAQAFSEPIEPEPDEDFLFDSSDDFSDEDERPVSPVETEQLLKLKILSPDNLDRACREDRATRFLVADLIPRRSIGFVAGDSGLGKSPFFYQLGLCVATGRPFAGRATEQGRVLYYDLENSTSDSQKIRDSLLSFLGAKSIPQLNWLIRCEPPANLRAEIKAAKADLVIIDTLRSYRPEASENNRQAGELLKALRALVRELGCTILVIHHLRKPKEEKSPWDSSDDLGSTPVVTWLLRAEGARALVNNSDFRIGLEAGKSEDTFNVKANRRVHGDNPLMVFERQFNQDSEPIGYAPMVGADLLGPDKAQAFAKLPNEFSFTDARTAFGKGTGSTGRFLNTCIGLDLIQKLGRGTYRKVPVVVDRSGE